MRLNSLKPAPGAKKDRHRVGRGVGSGWGKTGGRGQKGQKARRNMRKLGFQGGQMPLQRRLPKVGFNNVFKVEYAPVNVCDLEVFEAGSVVDEAALRKARVVRGRWDGVKVLAGGDLDRAIKLKVDAISAAAREKIEKAGGSVELLPRKEPGPRSKGE